MKSNIHFIFKYSFLTVFLFHSMLKMNDSVIDTSFPIENNDSIKKSGRVYVQFELLSKNLYDVIESLAEIKKINIFIPSSIENEKVVINFATKNEILLEEVEEYLLYFLNMSGYILTLQDNLYVVTKKTDDGVKRYALPLYVNIKPEDLPENVGYIRAIYFFKHVKVPLPSGQGSTAIKEILFSILPDKYNSLLVDPRTNSIIMTGPANAIAAAMLIINEIDNFGDEDYVYYLKLQNTTCSYVAKLIEDLLNISKESNPQNPANIAAYQGPSVFSPQIKIVQDQRNNGIFFLGKKEAVDKIVDFIKGEIDIKQNEGTSLIHVYELKYLDSKKIAPILQDLVNGTSTTEGDQSVKDNAIKGAYKKFEGVRIIPEEAVVAKRAGSTEGNNSRLTLGGNKLIIAATKDDYREIVKILDTLDHPQPQVIIEVMILDLQYDLINNFSSQSRLPSMFNLPYGAGIQSVMLDNSRVILNNGIADVAVTSSNGITPATSLNSDLFSSIGNGDVSDGTKLTSLANNSPRNGLIISVGEQYKYSSIWSILQMQETVNERNVIQNPVLVTQNNVPAKIQNVAIRRGAGELSPNNTQYGGATVLNIQSYTASLAVQITPRISPGRELKGNVDNKKQPVRLNLEINMAVEDWRSGEQNDFTKYSRAMRTDTIIDSGNLLVLGGLHKQGMSNVVSKVPILGDLPLIGGLFRQTVKERNDSNLVVIIKATVIEEDELNNFSQVKKEYIVNELNELPLARYISEVNHIEIADISQARNN